MYSPSEEAIVLRNYLDASIKDEIENLGEDISAIWARLDSKYGDKSRLVDLIMGEFKRMKRPGDKLSDMLLMINTVEKAHRDLQRLGKEHEIDNSTIISMTEEKLPPEIETKWMDLITGENKEEIRENKFPALLKLLLQFKERIQFQMILRHLL